MYTRGLKRATLNIRPIIPTEMAFPHRRSGASCGRSECNRHRCGPGRLYTAPGNKPPNPSKEYSSCTIHDAVRLPPRRRRRWWQTEDRSQGHSEILEQPRQLESYTMLRRVDGGVTFRPRERRQAIAHRLPTGTIAHERAEDQTCRPRGEDAELPKARSGPRFPAPFGREAPVRSNGRKIGAALTRTRERSQGPSQPPSVEP